MLPIYSEICYVFCTCYGRACASGGRYQTVTNSNFKQSCIIPISSNLACLDNKSFLCHSSVFLFSPLYIQDTGNIYIYHYTSNSQPPSQPPLPTGEWPQDERSEFTNLVRFKRIQVYDNNVLLTRIHWCSAVNISVLYISIQIGFLTIDILLCP